MSGSIAALAAFTGVGTQATAVTNDADASGVFSTILSQRDTSRQLISGSGIVEVSPSFAPGVNILGRTITFEIPNDIDVINEMYLSFGTYSRTGYDIPYGKLGLIDKIEVLVGSQVWQTITPASIVANNISQGLNDPRFRYISYFKIGGSFTDTVLPSLSDISRQFNNGYLQCASPRQTVYVKVYLGNTNQLAAYVVNSGIYVSSIEEYDTTSVPNKLQLFIKTTSLSNLEREKLTNLTFNKRVCYSQTISKACIIPVSGTSGNFNFDQTINLDSFSNYSSAIFFSIRRTPGFLSNYSFKVELLLNNSSFFGKQDLNLFSYTNSDLSNSLTNTFTTFTAQLSGPYGTSAGNPGCNGLYCIPLANHLYGSGIPLNKFDTIQLKITGIFYGANTTGQDLPDFIDVVSVGEASILYKNGSSSINKY